MNYYRFLATNAYVIGTDEQEIFTISKNGDDITVTTERSNSAGKNDIIYTRRFNQKDTKKIYILGLDGNDHFKIDENVHSSIKLQLEGGKGHDVYNLKGKIKSRIEDADRNDKTALAKTQTK